MLNNVHSLEICNSLVETTRVDAITQGKNTMEEEKWVNDGVLELSLIHI